MLEVDDRFRLDQPLFHLGKQILPARHYFDAPAHRVLRIQQADGFFHARRIMQIK